MGRFAAVLWNWKIPLLLIKMKTFQIIFLVVGLVGIGSALPTLYEVNSNTNEGEAVMQAVASTVIPLEDLPVFKIGLGFGLGLKDKKPKKPTNLKDIQLITAKNQHRFVAAAGVKELSKEEFEQFNLEPKNWFAQFCQYAVILINDGAHLIVKK